MDYATAKPIADRLNAATQAGDLASAYGVLGTLARPDAQAVMLAAGHSVTLTRHRREFFSATQASLAGASHSHLDGWAYTARRKALAA